jgi:glutathione peroxidase
VQYARVTVKLNTTGTILYDLCWERPFLLETPMLKALLAAAPLVALFATLAIGAENGKADKSGPLQFVVKDIDGKDVNLSQYQGKVVMIVNVASKCGNTPQYEQLEALHKKYADKGLVILGFPANEFGKQEPGTNAQIKEFCTSTYQVDFPMFSKIVVKGKGQADLYKFLTSKKTDPDHAGEITWNFEKFLVGRNGQVVERFKPKTKPDAPEVVKAIEAELNK